MNKLLKWSVTNSGQKNPDGTVTAPPSAEEAKRTLTPDMINALMGGPSDADLMKAAMEVLHSDESDLDNKLIAFDNFEQLIESIDNANNLEPLGLWTPLVQLLKHEEADMRRMAAWCIGTAVQNNEKAQDRVCLTCESTIFEYWNSANTFDWYAVRCFEWYSYPGLHGYLRFQPRRPQEIDLCAFVCCAQLPACHE